MLARILDTDPDMDLRGNPSLNSDKDPGINPEKTSHRDLDMAMVGILVGFLQECQDNQITKSPWEFGELILIMQRG